MPTCVVGVPKEVKEQEGRVGISPSGVRAIATLGAAVIVESGAGLLSGFSNKAYEEAGALIVENPHPIWANSDIVVKIKEPVPSEYQHLLLLKGKTLFTYLHLAGSPIELTRNLLRNEITAIAYETVAVPADKHATGRMSFPLLVPMSKIAGTQAMRAAILHHKGVRPRNLSAVIIGVGNVGEAALNRAIAEKIGFITLFDSWNPRVKELKEKYHELESAVKVFSLEHFEEPFAKKILADADIVISGPMLPGGKEAPIVLTQKHFRIMKHGAYIADVSIDQGGSTAWTKGNPTKPGETFIRGARNLVFSAVPNIPGSTVPADATKALTQVTLPYVLHMVTHRRASHTGDYVSLRDDTGLRQGLQTWRGLLTNEHVMKKHGLFRDYRPLDALF